MAAPKVPDAEFIELYERLGGHETARHLGLWPRNVQQRRVRLERKYKRVINNPIKWNHVGKVIKLEFPDFQNIEIVNGYLIFFSDAHLVPGEKSTAHRALERMIKELQPRALIDGGDLLDFSTISRHHRIGWDDQSKVSTEIEWASDCLNELKNLGSKAMITKKTMGNHDQRFSGFFSNRTPEVEGVKGTAISDHFPGWGISWSIMVNDNEVCLTHRWKTSQYAPALNTLWSGTSYVTGHLHRQAIFPVTDLRGDRWGVDAGTLADIWSPTFRYLEGKPRNWRSGFAVLRFVNRKLRIPELLRVIDEKRGLVEWRGQDYTV